MSSIKLQGSTSGEITISAPAVAGTNTLTLPATTGSLMTSTFTGDINFDSDTLVVDSTNNRVGIGTSSPNAKLHVHGGDQTTANIDTSSDIVLNVAGTGASSYNGGSVVFSANDGAWKFAAIKGLVTSGNNNTTGDLAFSVRNANTDSTLTEAMRIDSSGNVLISGTTYDLDAQDLAVGMCAIGADGRISIHSSVQPLELARTFGDNSSRDLIQFWREGNQVGKISSTNTTTTYSTSSDYRLKENVEYTWNATSRLKQLKPARFNFIADTDRTVDGFIAHEVSDIVPEAITGEKDAMMTEEYEVTPAVLDDDGNTVEEAVMGTREVPDYQGIDQSKLVPLLVKTCQEQQTIIEDLQTRITALENN